MAKWKELGEVPDSDDESLFDSDEDSQQPELPQPPQLPTAADADTPNSRHLDDPTPAVASGHDHITDHNKDVWDVPTSSQSLEDLDHLFPDDLAPSSSFPILDHRIESASTPRGVEADFAEPSRENEELTTPTQTSVAAVESSKAGQAKQSIERSSLVIELGVNTDIDKATAIRIAEDEIFAREEAVRQGRSFRPRKPIQEHPYLLESAHYSSLFKSRGIRPVRLALEEAAATEARKKDSQEEDYEEDTQSTGGGVQDTAEESQLSLQHNSLDDRDELALSSPPSRRSPTPTERPILSDNQRSSQNDDDGDELPTLEELIRRKSVLGRPRAHTKRRGSPNTSSKRKQARVFRHPSPAARGTDIFDIPPSPPQTSPQVFTVTPVDGINNTRRRKEVASITPKPSSADISRDLTPIPIDQGRQPIDLTVDDDSDSSGSQDGVQDMAGSDAEDLGNAEASSSPERAPDLNFRRKIRGVLPASWIRLDQQLNRTPAFKPTQRRSPEASPERPQRKGVAQRRIVSPKPSSTNTPFFFDDDESDNDNTTNDTNLRNNDHVPISYQNGEGFSIFEDDADSVIEDDHIDHMLPSRKRNNPSSNQQPAGKRRKVQNPFSGQPGARKRQQRITGLLNRSGSGSTTGATKRALEHHPSRKTKMDVRNSRQTTPPRLSILDVMQSDAPQFPSEGQVKGKASPTNKHISLGTRRDNVDVHDVLRSWKRGKIQSRLPEPVHEVPDHPLRSEQPLQLASANKVAEPLRRPPKPRPQAATSISRFSRPKRLAKQTSLDKFVAVDHDAHLEQASNLESLPPATQKPQKQKGLSHRRNSEVATRAAQLEMEEDEPLSRYAFDARKKALDALYRKTRKLPTAANARLERVFSVSSAAPVVSAPAAEPQRRLDTNISDPALKTRRRPRKFTRPRPVDTTADRYVHANDPLTEVFETTPEPSISTDKGSRLAGLGPYGTHYTQHFDVFPLDLGVFFHESTIIGEGRVIMASHESRLGDLTQRRGHCSISLGDITSSEIGLVFDSIVEQILPRTESTGNPSGTPVQAADFVLNYIQQHISFPKNDAAKMFAKRMIEIMPSFAEHLGSSTEASDSSTRQSVEVLTRLLIISLQILRICGKLNLPESLQVEDALKKVAQWLVRILLKSDLTDIRDLYDNLEVPRFRENGIRNDNHCVIAWVVLIRVLQEARIPRAGFWDVVAPLMLIPDFDKSVDARVFEKLWHDLFTILPLGEFDNQGVAVPGIRHKNPLEGWIMPQKLLGRVFDAYKSNQQQSPSFNDYCRGVVGRCHYLVEQWGWQKPHAVIGAIFDFFAGQKLAHLRNEEVYRSPQFLEDLAGAPSLKLQPEDRCFHIFLKLLAMAIQRLRTLFLIKDMKNLIARVLPNHDRQYLRESDVHESDLSALRNHHDLLCTLFWCAPPDLRPSVQTIQKLVVPGSSHKEACLINIRAWNQLARYVVTSRVDRTIYKPFVDWQNDVFKQVLDQYNSVESDIQQQFSRLSKDASKGVSPELMKSVANANKQAAADVLRCSLQATLDVVRHAPRLDIASLVINTYQLHEVFTRFSRTPPELEWSTLQVALDIVESHLSSIQQFLGRQNVPAEQAEFGEDAVIHLDRSVAVTFFSMARTIVSSTGNNQGPHIIHGGSVLVEKVMVVAGRFAAISVRYLGTRLSRFFASGDKFRLFECLPSKLSLASRRYLCLFFAILLESGVIDFQDLDTTPLWVLVDAIAKPSEALTYENRLAYAVKQHATEHLQDVPVELGNSPDYNSNRDLFEHILASLRKSLRGADNTQRKTLRGKFIKAVQHTMEQVKRDLATLVDTPEHARYISFVQAIIHLIKSQDYPVDPFFYEFSSVYAPPAQDPSLQTAKILALGLDLEDDVTGAVSTLSYYLYSNFKAALRNAKLEGQSKVVQEGMRNTHIMSFMLNRMIPAIIRTAVKKVEGWILLDVYVRALEHWFDADCIHREFGEEAMGGLLALLSFVYTDVQLLQRMEVALGPERLHTLTQMTKLLNLLSPSMAAFLFNDSRSRMANDLREAIEAFTEYTHAAGQYLADTLKKAKGRGTMDNRDATAVVQIDPVFLFEGVQFTPSSSALGSNDHINSFSKYMIEDIAKDWENTGSSLTIRGPAGGPATTQSGQGTLIPQWNVRKLATELLEELKQWNSVYDKAHNVSNRRCDIDVLSNMPF
ncbi:hypothetical protein PG993_007832 [Apiospora rasikravindrae]|uniref:Mus7/MMS22 family protein n=1 Tax=Apiospora rasikravindrae TaxID=990691 RepID=A0ABR1SYL5_9PEZI